MGHVIYNLVKNPDIQEKLYQELRAEVTPGQHVKPEVLEDGLKYLKAVLHETQRYFAVHLE